MNTIEQNLLILAQKKNPNFFHIEKLIQSGSNRQYFRIFTEKETIIGVYNQDVKENNAFFTFTNFFLLHNLNVPKIIAINETQQCYLLEDLGDTTLYSFLTSHRDMKKLRNLLWFTIKKHYSNCLCYNFQGKKELIFQYAIPDLLSINNLCCGI